MSEYKFQFLILLLFLFTFYSKNLESTITEVGYLAIITAQVPEFVLGALSTVYLSLYYYMKNYCNLIGLEQCYFSLI